MGTNSVGLWTFLLVSFVSLFGKAQPAETSNTPANPLQLELIPVMWAKTTCLNETLGCYTLDQVKILKQYDIDLKLRFEECKICQQNLTDASKINASLAALLDLSTEREKDWQTLADTRCKDAKSLANELANCENSPTLWSTMPWLITGAVALVGGSFLIGYLVGLSK